MKTHLCKVHQGVGLIIELPLLHLHTAQSGGGRQRGRGRRRMRETQREIEQKEEDSRWTGSGFQERRQVGAWEDRREEEQQHIAFNQADDVCINRVDSLHAKNGKKKLFCIHMHTHIWLYICISIYISTQALLISIMLYQPNHAKLWKHTTLVSKIQDTFCYFCQSLVFLLLRKNSFHTELISVQPWSHLSVSSESKETLSVKLKTASRFDKICCVFLCCFFLAERMQYASRKEQLPHTHTPNIFLLKSKHSFFFLPRRSKQKQWHALCQCMYTHWSFGSVQRLWVALCTMECECVCVCVSVCEREYAQNLEADLKVCHK